MSVGHALGKIKLCVNAVRLFLLHGYRVIPWLWGLLRICLIHSDFTNDLISELLKDIIEESFYVLSRLSRLVLNILGHFNALVFLGGSELGVSLVLRGLAGVDEAEVCHL